MAPSGGGKSFSALLLAMGIQQECGGDIYVIDSDNNRALHYAGTKTAAGSIIKFKHVPFSAPHDSISCRDALRYCEAQKAGVIIFDTLSKEHEGEGGMLEAHETELDRLAGTDFRKRESMNMLAWAKPKAARRKLIQAIQELETHAIFTFRAKQGVKPIKVNGKTEVVQQGFTPIAGDEMAFEMTLMALLLPHSGGIATWESEFVGERMMIKLPEQFAGLRTRKEPLDEKLGVHLARWAKGGVERPKSAKPAANSESRADPAGHASTAGTATDGGAQATGTDTGLTTTEGLAGDKRPQEAAAAQNVAASSTMSASATDASGASAEETSSPRQGELLIGDGSDKQDDGVPGNKEPARFDERANDREMPEEETEPVDDALVAFADAIAEAKTWPNITAALVALTNAPWWSAADYGSKEKCRAAMYHRLLDLRQRGDKTDHVLDMHAYRAYIAYETDIEALKGTRAAAARIGSPAWDALQTNAKSALDRAFAERLRTLEAGPKVEEFA